MPLARPLGRRYESLRNRRVIEGVAGVLVQVQDAAMSQRLHGQSHEVLDQRRTAAQVPPCRRRVDQ
ncbi:MAG: hypothetical protein IPM18_11520 [Phycisphaerales bacterium]|nr:hypothetical protein [Phycisphaerales bacterium]